MAKRISGHCIKCGTWRKSLHRDHVVPKAFGGTDDPTNIQFLCANCHQDKTEEDKLNPAFEVTRAKLRAAKLGKKMTLETRAKMSQAQFRRYEDPKERLRTGESLIGHAVSDETKRKIGAGQAAHQQRKRAASNEDPVH